MCAVKPSTSGQIWDHIYMIATGQENAREKKILQTLALILKKSQGQLKL